MRRALSLALACLLGPVAFFSAAHAEPAQRSEADWAQAAAESAEHLSRLVHIRTVNPPGNERAACDYIAGILEREHVPFDIFESTPGRASIIARLKGDGSRRPLLLLSHLDTVGVEGGHWAWPSFSGRIKKGMIEGRGSIDDKSMVAAALEAIELLRREGVEFKRDVIYAAVADEESGGELGIQWLLKRHPDKIAAQYAINEGGTTQLKDGKVRLIALETLEKRYYDIRLTAHGASGHSAVPHPDNAIYLLARALSNLSAWRAPMRLNPVTRAYLSEAMPLEIGRVRRALEDVLSDDPLRQMRGGEDLQVHPYYYAMVHDTVVPTVIAGGIRENVVASEAWVNLNVRLLPDTDLDRFLENLRRAVDEPGVEINVVNRPQDASSPAVPADNDFFKAFSRVAQRLSPGAVVTPSMAVGSTDSEFLRRRAMVVYGFEFPLDAEQEARIHGNDERMPVASLAYGVRFFYELIKEIAQ